MDNINYLNSQQGGGFINPQYPNPQLQDFIIKNQIGEVKAQLDYERKCRLEILKADIKEKQIAGMEARRALRENAQSFVEENIEGYLTVVTQFPDNKMRVSLPILKIRKPVFYIFNDGGMLAAIDSIDIKEKIYIMGKNISAKGIARALVMNGFPILCNQKNRKEYENLIFDYFLENAQVVTVAEFTGWNKKDNVWFFAPDYHETLNGIAGGTYD